MDNKESLDLAIYRLEQSKENLEEAEALFNINKFKGANNRAYFYREKSDYVDFYIITKEECEEQIETAKEMINLAEEYLKERRKDGTSCK